MSCKAVAVAPRREEKLHLPRIRANYSRREVLDVYLRGNKLGKIDFGQEFERFEDVQVQNERIIAQLKSLNGQGRMTSAVAAGIAIIIICVMFKRGTGTLVRCGNIRI